MVPLWMHPVAIACGNTFILKPSERDPGASDLVARLYQQAGLPDGVFNVVHGDKVAVDAILEHPRHRRGLVRRLDADRQVRPRGRLAHRQAGPGPRRRQEPRRRDARRRPRLRRRPHRRGGLRLGRPALHGDLGRRRGRTGRRHAGRQDPRAHRPALKVGAGTDPDAEMGPVVTAASRDRIVDYIGQGEDGRRQGRRRRPRPGRRGPRGRLLRRPHAARPRHHRHVGLHRRDLRTRAHRAAGSDAGRGDRARSTRTPTATAQRCSLPRARWHAPSSGRSTWA